MDKMEMVEEILRLYDENKKLQSMVCVCHEPAVQMSALEKMAVELGREAMKDRFVFGWHFDYYAPKVTNRNGEILTFKEWYDSITPKAFDEDLMVKMFNEGKTGFNEFKYFLEAPLKEFYEEKVENEQALHKEDSNETV